MLRDRGVLVYGRDIACILVYNETMMSHTDPRVERTRRAILEAAAHLLTHDRSASMATIAREAGVGRATLHRHFATRDALLLALALLAIDCVSEAINDARPGEGSPVEAMLRIAAAVLPVADELRFVEAGAAIWSLEHTLDRWYSMTAVVEDLVRRGQADGSIRPDHSVAWVADLFLGVIWTAADSIRDGRLAPHNAAALVVDTILHGVAPR